MFFFKEKIKNALYLIIQSVFDKICLRILALFVTIHHSTDTAKNGPDKKEHCTHKQSS